jgi:ABC-type uncharacterized transport system auxiliary subunit
MRSLLLLCLASCALTSKAKPVEIRYFSPATHEAKATTDSQGRARLGRITASSHLRYRIAHRRSAVEVDLSDTLRWAEEPEDYVRRAVAEALFVEHGVEQVTGGDAPELTIEVTAFEHVERGGRHYGSVQLRYQLDDDNRVLATDVVTVERPAANATISTVVTAIGDALDAASAEVAAAVAARVDAAIATRTRNTP